MTEKEGRQDVGRKRITMYKYPYDFRDGIRNVKEYGQAEVLRHDWERTKEITSREMTSALFTVLGYAVAIPVAAIMAYQVNKRISERMKKEKRLRKLKAEGATQ